MAFRIKVNQYALNADQDMDEGEFGLAEEMATEYRAMLMRRGYDGIVYQNEIEGGTSYIVFEPHQVKSAVGNVGAFNPNSPDISEGDARL